VGGLSTCAQASDEFDPATNVRVDQVGGVLAEHDIHHEEIEGFCAASFSLFLGAGRDDLVTRIGQDAGNYVALQVPIVNN
jgi:hypothetical protein